MPIRGVRRSVRRAAIAITAVAAAVALVAGPTGTSGTADAEPPNLTSVPSQLPEDIDAVIPPPPVKKLSRIPERSRIPGASQELQELREALMPSPSGDRFFDHWPAGLGARTPGEILSTRSVTRVAQPLVFVPLRSARQVKFRTTDANDAPMFGTATLLVPAKAWTGRGARPVLINNSPIVALGTRCTTGFTYAHGFTNNTNETDLIPPFTQLALDRGYAVLVPDHTGPRMAYAEPYVAAHVILDSVRAAADLDPTNFAYGPIAMVGYSGGAIATHGAAKLAAGYAPDIAGRFVGAAIGGVPADYRSLAGAMNANLASGVFHAGMLGVARERPEVLRMSNNLARWLATSEIRNICTDDMGNLGIAHLPTQLLSTDPDPFHSALAEKLFEVTAMSDLEASMPLLIYHGRYEWWVPASQARALFDQQCALGATAIYREYGAEHVSAAALGFPDTARWLDDRLRGLPAPNGCRR
ncbi:MULTISPECIES: lipase family protein [Gordonia]|uniref:lipase family protein n=1 Tax=Gordonia TaxID=2053 RepID=UPI00339240C4